MITCRAAAELITAYADGELANDELAALDAHLAQCPECRQCLCCERAMKSLIHRQHCPAPAPDHLAEKIKDAVARATRRPGAVSRPGIAQTIEPLPSMENRNIRSSY